MVSKRNGVIPCLPRRQAGWTRNLCFILWTIFFLQILNAQSPKVLDEFILPEGTRRELERQIKQPQRLDEHPIFVGAARAKITPDLNKPVWLAGFSPGRLAKGLHDDLWIHTIWIDAGAQGILMISLDLVGYLFDEVETIKKEIKKKFEIDEIAPVPIFIAATHNHSGPDTIGLWGKTGQESGKDPEYMDFVREKILQCVEEAQKNAKPARFRFGKTKLPELIVDARKPVVKNPLLLTMQAVDYQGQVIATLVNYAVHAEVLDQRNQLITADFPGFLRKKLEEHFGEVALFFPADIGGMQSPRVWLRSFASAKRYGKKIARAAIQSLKNQKLIAIDFNQVQTKTTEVLFPVENQRFLAGIEMGLFGETKKHLVKKTTHPAPPGHPSQEGNHLYLPSHISHIVFGPAEFLCIPGELFPELGNEIRVKMQSEYKFLLGLCNNEIGYIVPEEQWRENGYEESMSLGKNTAKTLLNEVRTIIK